MAARLRCSFFLTSFTALPIPHGGLSRSIITGGATLTLYRELQKTQREALAADWALALADWQSIIASMIATLRATKRRRTWWLRLRAALKWLTAHPEAILPGAILGLATCVMLVRTLR